MLCTRRAKLEALLSGTGRGSKILVCPEGFRTPFELDAVLDDLLQERVVHVLGPQNAEERLTVRVAGDVELITELIQDLPFRCHREMLLGRTETDNERALENDHGLVPFDLGFDLRERGFYPLDHAGQLGSVFFVGDFF